MLKTDFFICLALLALQCSLMCESITLFRCTDEKACIKEYHSNVNLNSSNVFQSLNNCRLVCGTYGSLWPRPSGVVELGKQTTAINHENIRFEQSFANPTVKGKTILTEMKKYFLYNLRKEFNSQTLQNATGKTLIIKLHITSNETKLSWSANESYKLKIILNFETVVSTIDAYTIFGARHGLETLLQLFTTIKEENSLNSSLHILSYANIIDQPIYAHRGLMIDTARNFIPIKHLKRQLDAMAASKLNVFHWHITDTQSFPVRLDSVPEMTTYGAYSTNDVYSRKDVERIIKYAKILGIRVIFELDAPAHAGNGWQWGPEKDLGNLAVCVNQQPWRNFCIEPPCGQLNPVNPNLYTVLQQVYIDLAQMNTDESVIHMGGDEVFFGCWNATEEIVTYMKKHNLSQTEADFISLWSEYQDNVLNLWDNINLTRTLVSNPNQEANMVILWSSSLTDPLHIKNFLSNKRYVIQTWVPSTSNIPGELQNLGYKLIVSTKDAWYLDHGFWGQTTYYNWKKVYDNKLPKGNGILGGEACVWTEYIDAHSIDGRTWPRAAAAAERLWSNPESKAIESEQRFFRHRERLITRGIQPEAIAPKWCEENENQCH